MTVVTRLYVIFTVHGGVGRGSRYNSDALEPQVPKNPARESGLPGMVSRGSGWPR